MTRKKPARSGSAKQAATKAPKKALRPKARKPESASVRRKAAAGTKVRKKSAPRRASQPESQEALQKDVMSTPAPTPTMSPAVAGNSRKLPSLPPTTLTKWLRDMHLIREFEVRCMQSYQEKKIGGFCHVYIGQEAVAVGCTQAVRPEDPIITAYRDHGHALARGMTSRACMSEMYGKVGGCAKGKGGSMHMFDRPNHLYGGHGIVGAQTPLGTGLAFATKYEDEVINGGKNRRVTLCFLGDGAVNQGAFYETMNLAGLFDIPVIFIVENNGYSMGTAINRGTTMSHDLCIKGRAHGLKEATIDGMDVVAVYNEMHALAEWCRENSRPAIVDMKCYRYKGHSMSDPRKYRTREEEERHEANDPIGKFERVLADHGVIDDAAIKAIMASCREEVRDAIQFSNESPEPPLSDLYTDVFVEPWGPFTGSSQPEFTGGATNVCSFRATDGKEGLV
ncbi:MAG: Acetoin:2,6-dichlorophenolindophenol oxidoreductase subunit alpha [Planctomycetota bacterium]